MEDKTEEAELLFQKVDKADLVSKSTHNICLLATQGLLNYRKGNPEKARELYLESMKLAKETGNDSLVSKALVNMAREEIILGEQDMTDVISKIKDISKKTTDEDLKEDIKSVIELHNKKK